MSAQPEVNNDHLLQQWASAKIEQDPILLLLHASIGQLQKSIHLRQQELIAQAKSDLGISHNTPSAHLFTAAQPAIC